MPNSNVEVKPHSSQTNVSASHEAMENINADLMPLKEVGPSASIQVDKIDRYQRDSLHAEDAFARAVEASAQDDHEKAVQEYLLAAKIAETAREWHMAAVSLERIGAFLEDPKPPSNLERAFRTYHRAVAAYEQCGYFEQARRLLYRIQYLKLMRARQLHISIARQIEMFLFWLLMGFGYRPLRVIGTAVGVVFFYGLLYWSLGGPVATGSHEKTGFWESVYFSGTTFTTIGYGDFLPGAWMRGLVLTEGAFGMLFMGFFVVILANRMRH